MRRTGIDLGTTNTVAAQGGEICRVDDSGRTTLPSIVAFAPNGDVQVGLLARSRRAIDSANTLFSTKRIIGRRFDSHETKNFRDRYPFEIEEMEDGWPGFRTRAGLLTSVQVATHILEALVKATGIDPAGPVTLTIPASFVPSQREATLEAAAAAGFSDVTLLEEPLATAYAYIAAGARPARGLVYDLGGGTFDCAVIDCTEMGTPRIVSHASDLMLGGDDLDHRLAGWVRHNVIEKHNWDLASYSEVYDRLLVACEDAKIALSAQEQASFQLGKVDPECPAPDEEITLTRQLLNVQCRELLQRSFGACDAVLRKADLRPGDIDTVFLAGGSTLLPVVREGVEAYFGRPGSSGFDPTEVVALGASIARVG